ncbi:MAG: TIGR03620 family F420-dependent LLM class oxidoreductase [Acidimicrobiia bacterium]
MSEVDVVRSAIGPLGVFSYVGHLPAGDAIALARRVESLRYGALWISEGFGTDPLATLALLGASTERLHVATGIANIWLRSPGTMMQSARTLAGQSDGRFILGLGVGHRGTVVDIRGLSYDKPLETMRRYLAAMDAAPWLGPPMDRPVPRVLAALGPRMLELARDHADGALPFLTTPAHTAEARAILGPDKLLCVGQNVVVGSDATKARAAISRALEVYKDPTNYRNNWLRQGFSATEIDERKPRFLDAVIPWGSAERVWERIREHYDAGADHVCIHPIDVDSDGLDWNALEEFAPAPAGPASTPPPMRSDN